MKAEFAQAAKAKDRTGAQLLRDLMRELVRQQQEAEAHDGWFRREVQAGIDAADAALALDELIFEKAGRLWRQPFCKKN